MSDKISVVPSGGANPPESSKDPIRLMIEVAENENLSPEDKAAIISYSTNRFRNRRKMAFIALYTIIFSTIFLFVAALIDGISGTTGILQMISKNQTLIIWLEGFLVSIIAAYYGVSALRPSS